jgi:hypothetical protein
MPLEMNFFNMMPPVCVSVVMARILRLVSEMQWVCGYTLHTQGFEFIIGQRSGKTNGRFHG